MLSSTRSTYWLAALAALVVANRVTASGLEETTSGGASEPSAEPYAFSYSANSVGGYSDRQESGDASGRVQGFYTMMGDDGRMRRVDYVADENGYRARISTNEIGTRTGPTGDAMYTVSQPSAGQLEAARVSSAEYAALESPHLLAARIGNGRMALVASDEEAWRSRLQAEPGTQQQPQQQQQVQQQGWRLASKPNQRTGNLVQDLSTAQETNSAPQAVLSYQQQQRRLDRRLPVTNNFRSNLRVSDSREGLMWASQGLEGEQQQQSNVVDAQDQLEITTTTESSAPITSEPQVTVKIEQSKSVSKVKDESVQTESPVVSVTTVDQVEQVDVMSQSSTGKAVASTTTDQPTTTTTSSTTTTAGSTLVDGQEQEQPGTTTLIPAAPINSQQVTTTTTKQLQRTSVAPQTTQEVIATRTSPELTTEAAPTTTTTTAATVAKTTRQPIIVIETNRAALREQSEQQSMRQMNRIASGAVKGRSPNRGQSWSQQQVPARALTATMEKSQEQRSTSRPVLIQVPQVAQVSQQRQTEQSSLANSAQATKGGYTSKTGSRQQAFWRARMLRNGQTPDSGESTGFGARTSALN